MNDVTTNYFKTGITAFLSFLALTMITSLVFWAIFLNFKKDDLSLFEFFTNEFRKQPFWYIFNPGLVFKPEAVSIVRIWGIVVTVITTIGAGYLLFRK